MNYLSPTNQPNDWGAFIMGLILALGAASMLALVGFLVLFGLSAMPGMNTGEPLSILILAGGTFVLGILLLPGCYFNFRRFFHKSDKCLHLPALDDRILIPALITTWLLSLILGQISTGSQMVSVFVLPVINIFAIGLPILFYIRISLRGLEFPSARRGWSIFGASLVISPALAFIFEALAVGVIILLFMVYASFIPGLQDVLKSLINSFQSSSRGEDETMRRTANLLFAPGVAFTALGAFSLAVPLIEETIKTILIWPFLSRIRRPVDGFVLGILCGSAFALTENIGFASAGSADWAVSAAVRATSALPHIFNSGMFGWALVCAWKERRFRQLATTFLTIILVHGTWNAISLGLAMSNFAPYVTDVPFYLQYSYPWIAAWIVLALGTFGGLIFINIQMRKLLINDQDEKAVYNSRLLSQTLGENNNGNPKNPD